MYHTARPLLSATPLSRQAVATAVRALTMGAGAVTALLVAGYSSVALAQTPPQPGSGTEDPLRLELSPRMLERLPESTLQQPPTFVFGDTLGGRVDVKTVIEGNVELRRHDTVLRADRLEHTQADDTAHATGQVRIVRGGDVFEGPELQLKLDTFEGHFLQPRYSLLKGGGHGEAERLDFFGKDHAVARRASYTTCQREPGPDWMPDWVVTASSIDFNNVEEMGAATNGVLRFKGMPLLATPYLSFPLTDKRRSGVLPPTINIDNISGIELTLPYYLNLAPDHDATLYPTVMSKRGIDLGAEYRYLTQNHRGQARGAYMPSDKLRDADRWSLSLQHTGSLQPIPGFGTLGLLANLNRVSDSNYWRDFPRSSPALTQRLLPNDAVLSWAEGPLSATLGAHRWQVLQDAASPITPPYDRLPALTLRYGRSNQMLAGSRGWDWSLFTGATRFESARPLTISSQPGGITYVDGTRALAVAEFSKTWQEPGWYVKPSARLHARHYSFDHPLGNGLRSASVVVPTFTLDGGLVLERDARYFGQDFLQTLEPRAYFTRTPYRSHAYLPNYDSAPFDFNLATIFLPTPYAGDDRIADANALTAGAVSRLLDPGTGMEVLSVGLAQRFRFSDQAIVLPGETPISERFSDVLLAARLNWSSRWSLNTAVQFNPKNRESVRTTLGARYNPGNYRVFNAAYRFKRGSSEQFDFGWQWPLSDLFGPGQPDRSPGQWYSVGRINYSVPDRKIVDLLAGFEYDAGCWIGRIVLERLQRSITSANQRILFQLEFSGFGRVGSNPLKTLKDNVPRYQYLREEVTTPSRFERYE